MEEAQVRRGMKRAAAAVAEAGERRVQPMLHVGDDRLYNPLTDRELVEGEADYALVRGMVEGSRDAFGLGDEEAARLTAAGWVVAPGHDPSRDFLLKYVSLEAHTVCNQACYFCPVSVAPRDDYFMPTELYERIVGELAVYRGTVEAVFMISYNEPTVDKRFVEQARTIKQAGLPPAVLTNGSGLTPGRIDQLVEMGGLRYLLINLSTVDREHYKKTRGGDHLAVVMRHLEHARDKPVAEKMEIVVLGTGDAQHKKDHAELVEQFAGSRFDVKYDEVMDRAGYLQIGKSVQHDGKQMCGCDNVGSRPFQHLHITPHGKCVLCCEDYDEQYVVGDLTRESVHEVLTGDTMAEMRRWAYGVEEAPDDFICRRCVFALKR